MSATIFAPATAMGRAGVAMVRISGPGAGPAAIAMTGTALPAARRATLRLFRNPADGEAIDRGMLLWFPAPSSFTGEDVAEFHLHGGRAVIGAALEALGRQPGLAFAEPGGFARQAFRNGKLDLTSVEALADLVNSDTAAQRRQAQRQLSGELGRLYLAWRERLINTLAYLEAHLDFPEDDLPPELMAGISSEIDALRNEILIHLGGANRGERLREGLLVAVVGPPNAGKSSIVNALARRDVAIVGPEPGTTRDVIEVHLDLGGFPVTVLDTAGLREPGGPVEAEGIRRALARAEDADLRVGVIDGSAGGAATEYLDQELAKILKERDIVAVNKVDMIADRGVALVAVLAQRFSGAVLGVSAVRGEGLEQLCGALERCAATLLGGADGGPVPTRTRHRLALEACAEALDRAKKGSAIELMAEDMRLAMRELGRIVGVVDVDDILDIVFRDLCIGK